MTVQEIAIGDAVHGCDTWHPANQGTGDFDYIDLSSIDKDSKDITAVSRLPVLEAPSRARQIVRHGDVLVATVRPNLNGVAQVTAAHDRMTASTGYCVLRPDPRTLDSDYLFHWVKTEKFVRRMVAVATGANYPAVSDSKVKASTIPLPPLQEQKRIAAILDAADALRAKRRESIEKLDGLIQSVFLDTFGDPVTNPRGWEVVTVGDEISFLTSGSRGWAKYYSEEGDVFIRIQNLRAGLLDLGDVAFVKAPESAESRRTQVEPGDVLLSITADLGRTAVVPEGIGKAHINQHLTILRFTEMNPIFVAHHLASKGGQVQFTQLNREGVKAGLNFADVRSLRLTRPPLEIQRRFACIVETIQQQKARLKAHLTELDTLFASLQSRAFRGEL